MLIRVLQIKDRQKARNIANSLCLLADAQHDLPCIDPRSRFSSLPGLPQHAKISALILRPRADENQATPWELARIATWLLEQRHGVILDWACGYRKCGAVWVLIKTWATDAVTGKRAWFVVTPDDLAALREELV